LIQSHKLIKASDKTESQASDTYKSIVRLQWKNTKADM